MNMKFTLKWISLTCKGILFLIKIIYIVFVVEIANNIYFWEVSRNNILFLAKKDLKKFYLSFLR